MRQTGIAEPVRRKGRRRPPCLSVSGRDLPGRVAARERPEGMDCGIGQSVAGGKEEGPAVFDEEPTVLRFVDQRIGEEAV